MFKARHFRPRTTRKRPFDQKRTRNAVDKENCTRESCRSTEIRGESNRTFVLAKQQQQQQKKQQTQVTVGWLGKDRCDELRKKRSNQKRGRV